MKKGGKADVELVGLIRENHVTPSITNLITTYCFVPTLALTFLCPLLKNIIH
jgi:hypothetical protein